MVNRVTLVKLVAIVLLIGFGYFVWDGHTVVSDEKSFTPLECPTWQNHITVVDEWSTEFDANNPAANDNERRKAWYKTLENNGCEKELPRCPTGLASFTAYWNNWSYDYINAHPDADADTQMNEWDALMVQNNCSEEWLNPLANLIEQQAASATPVHWYFEAED